MKNKQVVIEKTKELLKGHIYEPLKKASEEFLIACENGNEKDFEDKFAIELKNGIATIDEALSFLRSDVAKSICGDALPSILKATEDAKRNGDKYCSCEACSLVKIILENLTGEILK